jgi:hypothetical protein
MFGLSLYEFITLCILVTGAIFWCGAVYQQLRDGVKELKWLRKRMIQLENRVDHIESHLGISKPKNSKPPF